MCNKNTHKHTNESYIKPPPQKKNQNKMKTKQKEPLINQMLQTWQRWYQTINQKLITYIEKQTKGVYFSFLEDADVMDCQSN